MNKKLIIKEISKNTSLTQKDCKLCLNAFIDVVNNSLRSGDIVNINGFGKFDVQTRKARLGFNPKTMQKILIPNKNIVKFKAYKSVIGD